MTPKPKSPGSGKPGGGSDGKPGDGKPSKVYGSTDASKGVSSAHEAIAAARQAGEPSDPNATSATPTVDPNVAGPAGKTALRPPSDRHQLNRVSPKSPPKAENTITLPEARDAVRQDIADIQAGNARWDPDTNSYVTDSGRRYKVESNGTVFPVDGPGFVRLDRSEYKALQALIRNNGDVEAAKASVARDPSIPPGSFDKAGDVYAHYRK
ncbi:MAG: hypothetical protein HOV94_37865 [Saccharothrix sp.]|nr:hypothetical protein [Saccharothrix sp.]